MASKEASALIGKAIVSLLDVLLLSRTMEIQSSWFSLIVLTAMIAFKSFLYISDRIRPFLNNLVKFSADLSVLFKVI